MNRTPNVEYELDDNGKRTGRWRARQYYAQVGDQRVPSQRKLCEWRS